MRFGPQAETLWAGFIKPCEQNCKLKNSFNQSHQNKFSCMSFLVKEETMFDENI